MNTSQITYLLKKYEKFKGVYPIDKIPYIKCGTLIVNTDISTGPGKHWVAITINNKRPSEYFDSFGLPPIHKKIIDYLDFYKYKYIYNKITLQNAASSTCGNYCVIYATLRCRGYKYNKILKIFTKNTIVNDKIALAIIKKLMPVDKKTTNSFQPKTFSSVDNKKLLQKDVKPKNWEKRKIEAKKTKVEVKKTEKSTK
jgi:hypothetical protein